MTTHVVTFLAPGGEDGFSFMFHADRKVGVVHHIGSTVSSFVIAYPDSTRFASAFVRAYCGPAVESYLSPTNEAIEVSSVLARLALRRLGLDGPTTTSTAYVDKVSDLSLAFSIALRERWGSR